MPGRARPPRTAREPDAPCDREEDLRRHEEGRGLNTLPHALLAHAASHPEDPWLFHPEGWHWPWCSWKRLARGAASWAEPLSALPPGTPTAFLWYPHPPAVALDLAIQAAGLVSVPVTDPAQARERGARAWAGPSGTAGPEGLEHVSLPSWDREAELPERPAGGVMVEGRVVTQEELVAAADRLQDAIGGEGREIVVIGRAPERWPDRAVFSWATVYGAVVLLAPDPSSLVGSAVWARPTVFQGSAAELAALRRAVEQEKPPFWDRRAGRLPFGRLRVVLCEEPVDESFWAERGVRVHGHTD